MRRILFLGLVLLNLIACSKEGPTTTPDTLTMNEYVEKCYQENNCFDGLAEKKTMENPWIFEEIKVLGDKLRNFYPGLVDLENFSSYRFYVAKDDRLGNSTYLLIDFSDLADSSIGIKPGIYFYDIVQWDTDKVTNELFEDMFLEGSTEEFSDLLLDLEVVIPYDIFLNGYFNTDQYYFSEAGSLPKDLEKIGSQIEEYNLEGLQDNLIENFGLSENRAVHVSKMVNAFKKISTKRSLTTKEMDNFSQDILGVTYEEAISALQKKYAGESEDLEELMERAAELNETTPEAIEEIVESYLL